MDEITNIMDERTFEIMAQEFGIDYSKPCPFKAIRCKVCTGLSNSQYQSCAFYNARLIEAWREKTSVEDKEGRMERELVLV